MAWRIHDHVVRGEIDNRTKGVVRGRIWLCDQKEPVALELAGNANPDVAGCLLTFVNPGEALPLSSDTPFSTEQRGSAGDITASRKVRVLDVPTSEALEMVRNGARPAEHMANCLYLEWFSDLNGRVVIEGVDWQLALSEPLWRLSAEDEIQRQHDAAQGWQSFVERLDAAVEAKRHDGPDALEDWDEFDWERSLQEGDACADKYRELIEKHGDDPDAGERIAHEMGWEDEEESSAPGEDSLHAFHESELDHNDNNDDFLETCDPDPESEGVDWIRSADGEIRHPLEERCFQQVRALAKETEQLELENITDRHWTLFTTEFRIAAGKVAAALNGLAYGRDHREAGFVVACLKRALVHLHAAHGGLAGMSSTGPFPAALQRQAREELFGIREEVLRLMQEFRNSR